MSLTDAVLLAVLNAVFTGGATWGIVSIKLQWLRADVDRALTRIDAIDARLRLGAPP